MSISNEKADSKSPSIMYDWKSFAETQQIHKNLRELTKEERKQLVIHYPLSIFDQAADEFI